MIWTSLIAQGKRRLLMSFLLAVLLLLGYLHLARFYERRIDSGILTIGWVLVIGNVLRAGLGGIYRWDRYPFERFDLGLGDDQASPGRSFRLEMTMTARRSFELRHLAAQLTCRRTQLSERGERKEVLHEEKKVLAESALIAAGEDRRFEVELAVPPDAPLSFRDFERRTRWSISIEAAVTEWGEIRDAFDVTVMPG